MFIKDFRPRFLYTDPENAGGGSDGGAGGAAEEWMAQNPHAEGDAADEVTVKRGEYNDLWSTRKNLGKDFDPEVYKQKSAIDMEEYTGMKSFVDIVEKNEKIYDVVAEMIKAEREGREPDFSKFTKAQVAAAGAAVDAAAGGQPKSGAGAPAANAQKPGETNAQYEQRLGRIESMLKEQNDEKLLGQFNQVYDKVLGGLKLSEREKTLLRRNVEDAFANNDKLTLKDIERITKEQYADIEEYRKELLGEHNRKLIEGDGGEPAPVVGAGAALPGKRYDPSSASPNERVSQMAKELKELQSQ